MRMSTPFFGNLECAIIFQGKKTCIGRFSLELMYRTPIAHGVTNYVSMFNWTFNSSLNSPQSCSVYIITFRFVYSQCLTWRRNVCEQTSYIQIFNYKLYIASGGNFIKFPHQWFFVVSLLPTWNVAVQAGYKDIPASARSHLSVTEKFKNTRL